MDFSSSFLFPGLGVPSPLGVPSTLLSNYCISPILALSELEICRLVNLTKLKPGFFVGGGRRGINKLELLPQKLFLVMVGGFPREESWNEKLPLPLPTHLSTLQEWPPAGKRAQIFFSVFYQIWSWDCHVALVAGGLQMQAFCNMIHYVQN